ncbi:hypothetical protein JYT28_01170 [Desulfobulbus sp. AH-315-M07]|nr:hypothetical protein [Desulfobulbus sp. AH-315-M07]
MRRHRAFIIISLATIASGFAAYFAYPAWHGWENILKMVSKGDNMPIAGLIPLIAFFTYLSLSEAFRHDRLIRQGRESEILDEMYK